MKKILFVISLMSVLLFVSELITAQNRVSADKSKYSQKKDTGLNFSDDPHVIACTKNRKQVADSPYRPLYHFSAPKERIHDPNGLCYWKGNYHLFYQYKVKKGKRTITSWGHTYSKDLLRWNDLPFAFAPTIEKACYSGQTYVEPGRVIAAYQGVGKGMMIATATDSLLLNWEKYSANPVIPNEVSGVFSAKGNNLRRILDNCIWKEKNGFYYALSGSYRNGGRGRKGNCIGETLIFKSKYLKKWEYLGPMYTDTVFAEPGEDMQVPNFWPIDHNKHMLLCFSHKHAGRGYVGTFDLKTARFKADYHFRENHGSFKNASLHAPTATIDEQGRYIGIFNTKEATGMSHDGWDGIFTLPRVYSLAEDNSLQINPIDEIKSLRFDHKSLAAHDIKSDNEEVLKGIVGRSMEIKVILDPGNSEETGINVLRSADGKEFTRIGYSANGKIFIDRKKSSLHKNIKNRDIELAQLNLKPGELLEFSIFIDQSIVEVFANGKLTLTKRVYPTKKSSGTVSLYSKGGRARLESFDAWQMRSVWPELKNKEGK